MGEAYVHRPSSSVRWRTETDTKRRSGWKHNQKRAVGNGDRGFRKPLTPTAARLRSASTTTRARVILRKLLPNNVQF
jgi:hypothetical protein